MGLSTGETFPRRFSLGQAMAAVAVASLPLAIVTRAAQGAGTTAAAWAFVPLGIAAVIQAELFFWGLVAPIVRAARRHGPSTEPVRARLDPGITWLDDAHGS